LIKRGGTFKKRSRSVVALSVSEEILSFREDFQRALDWRGVRMESRVYAAFGYVPKVVSNGRVHVNADLHANSRSWLRLCRLCRIADFNLLSVRQDEWHDLNFSTPIRIL
jgi:hypothetical protein